MEVNMGTIIATVRKEKRMTQKELADALFVSDKAVSKWERGVGYPDIATITKLATILEVDVSQILNGELVQNDVSNGNLEKTQFYYCSKCNNIVTSLNPISLSCCGKQQTPLLIQTCDVEHSITMERIEDELYVTMAHPMTKQHAIVFFAYVTNDKLYLQKLYPEQLAEARFFYRGTGAIFAYCPKHGLYQRRIMAVKNKKHSKL